MARLLLHTVVASAVTAAVAATEAETANNVEQQLASITSCRRIEEAVDFLDLIRAELVSC